MLYDVIMKCTLISNKAFGEVFLNLHNSYQICIIRKENPFLPIKLSGGFEFQSEIYSTAIAII